MPNHLVLEVFRAADFIKHHLEMVRRGPIAMQVERTARMQHTPQLQDPLAQPLGVVVNSAFPSIFKTSDLGFITPDNFNIGDY